MEIGECKTVYIKSLKENVCVRKYGEGAYMFNNDDRLIYWLDSDIVEISCKTCKFNSNGACMCDSNNSGWIYEGDKMENEMPELEPGMVVKLANENIVFIMGKAVNTAFVIENIQEVYSPKSFTIIETDKCLGRIDFEDVEKILNDKRYWELVWQRKPAVDWATVKTDTKVLVKRCGMWTKRYFAKYEDGVPYVFEDGCDSFTAGKYSDFFLAVNTDIVLYEGNEHLLS